MRALIRSIDKFCLKHRNFGIQRLMLYFVIGYAIIYLISMVDTSNTLVSLIYFDPARILRGEIWRLVTWIFYPSIGGGDSPLSLFFTAIMLYFYYFIGTTLEREWGTPKFTVYYLFGMLLHVVFAFIVWAIAGSNVFLSTVLLDSSFLNLSMFLAFAVFYPEQRVLLFFFIPIKIKWLALANAGIFIWTIITTIAVGRYIAVVLPLAALTNFYIFCGDDLMRHFRSYRAGNTKQAINFRKASKKYQQEETARSYRHKCSVCGKTDTDHPNLEFRYCSRCNGYHAYCIDHINNHVHFQ